MKKSKFLILLAALSMCVIGCNKGGGTHHDPGPDIPPDDEPIPDPGNPLTPPDGEAGFPVEAINTFLEDKSITDCVVPAIANDQAWSYKTYTYFPIIKLWTLESTTEVLYEDQYCSVLQEAEITVSDRYYERVGYAVLKNNGFPRYVFKSIGGYFVIYIAGEEYSLTQTPDGEYPYEQLDEYLDLMNVENVPPFPMIEVYEPGWKYQNAFYTEYSEWRLYTCCPDPNSPNSSNITGTALEDLYKDLLEAQGWEIDSTLYDTKGYFAYKEWVGMQFFSWNDTFRLWVYKK